MPVSERRRDEETESDATEREWSPNAQVLSWKSALEGQHPEEVQTCLGPLSSTVRVIVRVRVRVRVRVIVIVSDIEI